MNIFLDEMENMNIANIETGEELMRLMENSKDPNDFRLRLSNDQHNALNKYEDENQMQRLLNMKREIESTLEVIFVDGIVALT